MYIASLFNTKYAHYFMIFVIYIFFLLLDTYESALEAENRLQLHRNLRRLNQEWGKKK